MNNEESYTIYCSRCGAAMNNKSRYCMKCGNLNYDHEANTSIRRFIPKFRKKAYQVGSGESINPDNVKSTMSVRDNTGNNLLCFIVNLLVFIGVLVLSFFTSVQGYDLDSIMNSNFPIQAMIISASFLFFYSLELVFMKCNQAWWKAFIPVYNSLILADIAFHKKWLGLLTFIPGVNAIYFFVLFYFLGKEFNQNPTLTMFFWVVYLPIIGFGTSTYKGFVLTGDDAQMKVEKAYKRRRGFFWITMFVFIIGLFLWLMASFTNQEGDVNAVSGLYFTYTSKKVVSTVSNKIKDKDVVCRYDEYSPKKGVYYFQFTDVGDYVSLFLYVMRDPIRGYVKVDNTSGTSKYYISLSDGNIGFRETLAEDVNPSIVGKYNMTSDGITREMNTCRIAN